MKDNNQYELVLVVRSDDLEDLTGIFDAARKRVKKVIKAERIKEVGGEESGAESFCSGWYDFSIRNREMSADSPTQTQFPIRVNVDTE